MVKCAICNEAKVTALVRVCKTCIITQPETSHKCERYKCLELTHCKFCPIHAPRLQKCLICDANTMAVSRICTRHHASIVELFAEKRFKEMGELIMEDALRRIAMLGLSDVSSAKPDDGLEVYERGED